jgi:hypothetical protein
MIVSLLLAICLLTGCMGTPVVYYTNCTCPTGSHTPTQPAAPVAGALKTGLYISTDISGSKSVPGEDSTTEAYGKADYAVTIIAVLVDANGVIADCIIDGIAAAVEFDSEGQIVTDLSAPVLTKNELGDDYGMVAWGGAIAEWDEQAAALAKYAKGKTVDALKNGAIDETGKAPAGSDLASSATIYLGGYVAGIEQAVANAQYLGAEAGDELKLAVISSMGSSKSADAENAGNAQLDVDVTALTLNGDIITSCAIDSVQAKVAFDASGAVTTDVSEPVLTKNQLGAAYNMVAWGGAKAEWNEQAAAFAKYVTGKTAAEVAGIAVAEGKPADADLASSVNISIGGFQKIIEKACKG